MLYVFSLIKPASREVIFLKCFFLQPDCDSTIQIPSEPVSLTDCFMPCSGNDNETCGGSDRLNVFLDNAVPRPVIVQNVNGTQGGLWTYQGCYTSVLSLLSSVVILSSFTISIDLF
jgi:hypothetical protein